MSTYKNLILRERSVKRSIKFAQKKRQKHKGTTEEFHYLEIIYNLEDLLRDVTHRKNNCEKRFSKK